MTDFDILMLGYYDALQLTLMGTSKMFLLPQDFVLGLSILSRGTVAEKLRWTFSLYDINGDGLITREEMTEIVTAIYELAGAPTTTTTTTTSTTTGTGAGGGGGNSGGGNGSRDGGRSDGGLALAIVSPPSASSSTTHSHYPHLHLPHLLHGHHHQQQQQLKSQLDENIIKAKVERIFQVRDFLWILKTCA